MLIVFKTIYDWSVFFSDVNIGEALYSNPDRGLRQGQVGHFRDIGEKTA